jgi:hypothetical protein
MTDQTRPHAVHSFRKDVAIVRVDNKHNGFADRLVKAISTLTELARPFSSGEQPSSIPMSTPNGVWYWFDEAGLQHRWKCIKQFLAHEPWAAKFSVAYMNGTIKRLTDAGIDGGTRAVREELERIVTSFDNFCEERTVIVPIQGITIDRPELKVGRILLKRASTEYMEYVEDLYGMSQELRLRGMNVNVCGEYCVMAEQTKAVELAEDESRRSIDVIRYWLSFCKRDGARLFVGLFPEVTCGQRTMPIVGIAGVGNGVYNRGVGMLGKFERTDAILDHLRGAGVIGIAGLLEKPPNELSEFEGLIIRGLHWFGKAEMQQDRADAFGNLMTVLESFLTSGERPVAVHIAESVVMFFQMGVAERLKLRDRIKDLYGLRSKVTHSGSKAIAASEVFELRTIVRDFLAAMIGESSSWKTKKDLLDGLTRRRMS